MPPFFEVQSSPRHPMDLPCNAYCTSTVHVIVILSSQTTADAVLANATAYSADFFLSYGFIPIDAKPAEITPEQWWAQYPGHCQIDGTHAHHPPKDMRANLEGYTAWRLYLVDVESFDIP